MKTLCLMLLLFFVSSAATTAGAQSLAAGSAEATAGVAVGRISWRKEIRNPALDEDPFRHNREQLENARRQEIIDRQNAQRTKSGKTAIDDRGRPTVVEVAKHDPRVSYVYKAKVTNGESKSIRAIEWDYVFFEQADGKEVGRHMFKNRVKIQPGKSAELSRRTASPPTNTVDVTKTAKNIKEQYGERVEILRIEYEDGSVWTRPAK
ncbi:MAG TPA: hypothetical protein VK363_10555 [Pyrinomonadaceae bacterium]|nr:hypothetical protein [Pyrinomonadaceae bacterium]